MVCAGFCSEARKCDLTHTSLFLFPFIALVSCCRPIRNPPGGHAAKLFLGGGPRLKRMIIMLNTNPNAIDLVPVWEDKQNQTPTDRGKWGTPPQRLSGYEETILIGESKIPVNVRTVNHFGAEEATDGRTMETFVSNLCSLVMRSFEFLRGRLSLAPLERICSYGCRKRLRVFAGLLGATKLGVAEVGVRGAEIHLPLVPRTVEIYRSSPREYSVTLGFLVGESPILATEVVRLLGSRWVCTELDLG